MLLYKSVYLVDCGEELPPAVCTLPGESEERQFYAALNLAENVYGPAHSAARAVMQRWLVEGAVQFWPIYSTAVAEALALNEALPARVRAFAAALALGQPLPGAHGSAPTDPKGPQGGQPARLVKPRPTKPSGGASNPLAELLGSAQP